MDGIVGDVITIVRIIYNAVDGMKSNSAARSLLLVKLDAIQAITTTISDPAVNTPTASALLDIKETLQNVLDTIKKQEKRSALERMVKHTLEDADLVRLGDRLSQGQQQLTVAIAADNANQKAENAQEVETLLSAKVQSLPALVTDSLAPQHQRLSSLSSKVDMLGRQLENLYPTMERYQSRIPRWPSSQAPPDVGWGLVSSIISVGTAIVLAVQRVKNNRKEAIALGRRVQVVLDVAESMSSELMTNQFRREEVTQLLACLDRCAEAVGAQTSKGVGTRIVGIQSDEQTLRTLSKELSECLQRLGLELQLYGKQMDAELMFTISSNVNQLDKGIRNATDSFVEDMSTRLKHAEDYVERLQWVIDRIPFSAGVGGVGNKVQDLSEQTPLLSNQVQIDVGPNEIKSLSVNKGVAAAFPAPGWSQVFVGIGKIIHVYDFRSGQHEFELGRQNGLIQDLTVSPDDNKAASTGQDGTVKVWDVIGRKESMNFSLYQPALYTGSFARFTGLPQQRLVCSGFSYDSKAKNEVYFHLDARVVISGDGSIMARVLRRSSISLIATASMSPIRDISVEQELRNIALSHDGKYLYFRTFYPQEVTVIQAEGGAVVGSWKLEEQISSEQFFSDGTERVYIIAGTSDGALKTWDISSGVVQAVLRHGDADTPVVAVAVAENILFTTIAAALREDGIVQIWNLAARAVIIQLGVAVDHPINKSEYRPQRVIMLSPDGSRLFVRRSNIIATCTLHGLSEAIAKSLSIHLPPPPPPPPPSVGAPGNI